MKSWGWFLLFIFAVFASFYLWKKPVSSEPGKPTTDMAPVGSPNPMQPFGAPPPSHGIPSARTVPNSRPSEVNRPDTNSPPVPVPQDVMGQPPVGDESYPGSPPGFIPPPPPIAPFPEGEQPEYFDGDGVPPPFEPPAPLDESGGFVPPPSLQDPEVGE